MWVLLILGEINSGVLIDYFLKINIRLITTYLCINSYGEIVVWTKKQVISLLG